MKRHQRMFAFLGAWALWLGWALTLQAAPQITFEHTSFDCGDVPAKTEVTHTFTFTNTGDADLIIESLHSP